MTTAPAKKGMFQIEQQFAFYGAYHVNKVNVAIHMIFVPLIFATALVLLHSIAPDPSFYGLAIAGTTIQFTPSFLIATLYASYFVALEPFAGLLYAPILLSFGHYSNVLYNTYPQAISVALMVHVASWISQFIGHGVFEGRKPALFDSLFQSIVLAVFFVFLELLFTLGYRPKLHKRVQNEIGKALTQYRKSIKRVA